MVNTPIMVMRLSMLEVIMQGFIRPPTVPVRHVMVIIHSTTSSGFNSSWLNSAGGGKHGFD